MSLIDFGTVQIYETQNMVEVVFPYDKQMMGFLKSLKGKWSGPRKCWQVSSDASGLSTSEIISRIEAHLERNAPKKWGQVMKLLRSNGCVTNAFEVFCGKAGVRLRMPFGHPYHHHLKKVEGLAVTRDTWQVPASSFTEGVVQDALVRILNDDTSKFSEFISPVQERTVIGVLNLAKEQEEVFGLRKDGPLIAKPSFLKVADPVMADTPIKEFAFECYKTQRINEDEIKVWLEYLPPKEGYELLKKRVFADNPVQALTGQEASVKEDWVQRRS